MPPLEEQNQACLVCGSCLAWFFRHADGRNCTTARHQAGIYEDTFIIFSSDNGGPTNGDEGTSSNNFPLRGGKNTIWEGGTRVVGTSSRVHSEIANLCGATAPAAFCYINPYTGMMLFFKKNTRLRGEI